jgi:hypothetical protein
MLRILYWLRAKALRTHFVLFARNSIRYAHVLLLYWPRSLCSLILYWLRAKALRTHFVLFARNSIRYAHVLLLYWPRSLCSLILYWLRAKALRTHFVLFARNSIRYAHVLLLYWPRSLCSLILYCPCLCTRWSSYGDIVTWMDLKVHHDVCMNGPKGPNVCGAKLLFGWKNIPL